jgi:hypothetical protein
MPMAMTMQGKKKGGGNCRTHPRSDEAFGTLNSSSFLSPATYWSSSRRRSYDAVHVSSLSRPVWLGPFKRGIVEPARGLAAVPSYLKPVGYLGVGLANPLQAIVDDLHGLCRLQVCLRRREWYVSRKAVCRCRRIGPGWRVGLPASLGTRIFGGRPWLVLEDWLGANTVRSRWEAGGESSGGNWSRGSFGRQVGRSGVGSSESRKD